MPEQFKQFDFSKPEDQKEFEILSDDKKAEIKKVAKDEAGKMQDKIKNGDAADYNEAEKISEYDKFVKPTPVEEIIPNIKEELLIDRQQIEDRKSKDNHNGLSFWRITLDQVVDFYTVDKQYMEDSEKGVAKGENEEYLNFRNPSSYLIEDQIKEGKALGLFDGEIIVDLGAGDETAGYFLSQVLKGKAYVAVEPFRTEFLVNSFKMLDSEKPIFFSKNSKKDIKNQKITGLYERHIPYSIVKNDMLTFLKRLPDNSVSIIMGGVGTEIIDDFEYRDQVFNEINRVLSAKGGFLCENSDPRISKMPDLEEVSNLSNTRIIYKKKK
jgi:hypothetical protein